MHDIDTLIQELLEADPSLKGRESVLRGLLSELMASRPDFAMDAAFRERLKLQLFSFSALQRPRLARWRGMRLYYGVGTVALLVFFFVTTRSDQPEQVAFKATGDTEAPAGTQPPEGADTKMMTAARTATTTMQLTSTAFQEGQSLPAQYTCDGDSLVPPLAWTGVPDGTVSLAVVLLDLDAPMEGGFTHWVVYDIPADSAVVDGTIGGNGMGGTGYVGPCPPQGSHRYVFTLYALDSMLGLSESTGREGFLAAAEGHIIATAELIGTYLRK